MTRVARAPGFVAPQLCTLVAEPPEGDGWLHEVKFDGYRILCRLADGRATLWSRNEKDWTESFGRIASEAVGLPAKTALLDGEVVVVGKNGVTSFNALQNALKGRPAGDLAYYAFDLLHLDGRDLRGEPLAVRRAALRALLPRRANARVRLSEDVRGSGGRVFEAACRRGLEGIVSKRWDARYRSGRGDAWLKTKCHREQEFVIGGFTPSPFAARPRGVANARFVEPRLVAVVRFTEWTGDGRLRHPSFQGLREDKAARAVVREKERT